MRRESLRKLSIKARGLDRKLAVIFALMALLPLLSCFYIIYKYTDWVAVFTSPDSAFAILFALLLAFGGYLLVGRIFHAVKKLAEAAKKADVEAIEIDEEEGEIKDLAEAISDLHRRLKDNLETLIEYEQEIYQIKRDVQRREFAIEALLELGQALITANNEEDLVATTLRKTVEGLGSEMGCLLSWANTDGGHLVLEKFYSTRGEAVEDVSISCKDLHLAETFAENDVVELTGSVAKKLKTTLGVEYLLAGIISQNAIFKGLIVVGRNEPFEEEDKDVLKLFAKEMGLALENIALRKELEALASKDRLTGAYTEDFLRKCIEEELIRARNFSRAFSLVLVKLEEFFTGVSQFQLKRALKLVYRVIESVCEPLDKIGRFGKNAFLVLLPERSRQEAEEFLKRLESALSELLYLKDSGMVHLRISVKVASCPIDGVEVEKLLEVLQEENLSKTEQEVQKYDQN